MGVYLHLIPAGVGRAGDCIYINTPLKQLRSWTKQQRLARHILMATAAPQRLGTRNLIPHTLKGLSWTPLKDPLLNNLKDSDLTHLLSATSNLRIYHRSLVRHLLWMQDFFFFLGKKRKKGSVAGRRREKQKIRQRWALLSN